jgi:glycosyltransferase involved in cell wall biosynthesis
MKILLVVPLPPPITGQSLTASAILEEMDHSDAPTIINTGRESLYSGKFTLSRSLQVIRILWEILLHKKNKDIIYISLSESFWGNLKDLFVYGVCYNSLHKVIIHLLGGSGFRNILLGNNLFSKANKHFISKMRGVIVEGPIQSNYFGPIIKSSKVHIVPNFVEDYLFVSREEVQQKYESINRLEILYLSNLLPGKGYKELLQAFICMDPKIREKAKLSFVGGFESDSDRDEFLAAINECDGISYLGEFIGGNEKKALYLKTHVFCLPTYYSYEGVPISILEAYATGCVVVTTNHAGIPDVFQNGRNGFEVEKKSIPSLQKCLENIIKEPCGLAQIALENNKTADREYRISVYKMRIRKIFEKK